MKRWLKAILLGVLIGGGGVLLGLSPMGSGLEQDVGLPWLFKVRGKVEPPDDVVVVAMDSRTGPELDLPALPRDWPRSIHGRLVDALVARGASVIVFDVHFGREKSPESDQVLVDAVRRADRVVLVELLTGKRQPIADQQGRHVGVVWAEELVPPFAALAAVAKGLATFPLPKEAASVFQFWVFKESADQAPTMPAVALQLHARGELEGFIRHLGALVPQAVSHLPSVAAALSQPGQLRDLMRGLREIFSASPGLRDEMLRTTTATDATPLQQALTALYAGPAHRFINFYGGPGTIRTVPYHAVIKGSDPNVRPEDLDFTGKVVFVGFSDLFDPGQPDRFYTVFTRDDGVDLSGVEIAATSFANLLTDSSLAPVGGWTALLVLLLFGLLLGAGAYRLPAYVGVPAAFIVALGYAFAAQWLFNNHHVIVPFAVPLLVQFPLALFGGLVGQYLLERQRGQRISEAINYYLPDDIARDLAQDKLDPNRINKVVFSTCLATDMAGFSTIAEQMPPGELAKFLNDYFDTLAAPLKRHGVHVTEFRADAIMCAWTAEQAESEPRRKALLAALEAGEAIKVFKERHNMPGARLRIGLEAGWVYVGHAGGGGRFVYSIVGDSANTASRVEGLNKHVGTEILATGAVVEGFENLLSRYLGDFQFVGKTEGIPIYHVIAKREHATHEQFHLCEMFDDAMAAYRNADWVEATRRLEQLLAVYPDDGPSTFFLQRSRQFSEQPELQEDPKLVRMEAK